VSEEDDLMTEAPWRLRFRAPSLTMPSWARDNPDRLLYSTNASGKWEIYAWDRLKDSHRQVTDRPTGTTIARIDPSGEHIWWFNDARGNELGVWMAEAFEGGPAREAAPGIEPAFSAGLALGAHFSIIGSSLPGKGTQVALAQSGGTPSLLYAHRSIANVAALSRDETLVCISHTENSDFSHRALRVIDLKGTVVADLFDGPSHNLAAVGFSRLPGDERLLVVHDRRDIPELLVWDPVSGRVSELTLGLSGELVGDWYDDGRSLVVRHNLEGRSELYRYEIESERLERIPTETGSIGALDARPDGEVWYSWNNSSTPPEVRAGDRVLLRPPGERAPGGVSYGSHRVDDVPVFLAEPAGPRPHPTVFSIHGGPTGQDTDSFSALVQAWVDHGYAVVMVNYRGSSGYGRAWRDALVGNPGPTELEDIAKVHDWMVREGIAEPHRTILFGGSWGGYLTLLGLGTQPERWSLGIAAVPIADWLEQYEDVMEPLQNYDRALFGGSPAEIPEVYRRCSPATYVENVRVPVFILAGENDPRCPIRQVDSYVRRLESLEKAHEVYRFNAGHGSMVIEETLRQVEMGLAFAAKHLGTPGPR